MTWEGITEVYRYNVDPNLDTVTALRERILKNTPKIDNENISESNEYSKLLEIDGFDEIIKRMDRIYQKVN